MAPKQLGVGAICEALLKYMKPRKCLKDVYPNPEKGSGLAALWQAKLRSNE